MNLSDKQFIVGEPLADLKAGFDLTVLRVLNCRFGSEDRYDPVLSSWWPLFYYRSGKGRANRPKLVLTTSTNRIRQMLRKSAGRASVSSRLNLF